MQRHTDADSKLFAVITTIQQPTESVRRLLSRLRENNASLIVIGDKKGPASYNVAGAEFFNIEAQLELEFVLASKLPTGHYTRKNLGYLIAMKRGAQCIYETDDDNAPQANWAARKEIIEAVPVKESSWVNVYRLFSSQLIWPRGFPLDALAASFKQAPAMADEPVTVSAPVQQGLANNSPDVDAIWRLVMDAPFDFQDGASAYLPRGAWCPFNSQSTWWFPAAYKLLYLPSYCSFRMTDIWRSFIAQRCLWELNAGIVFHAPEVMQERNQHDLMRDFNDEISGYTGNRKLAEILEALPLLKGADSIGDNLLACYKALVEAGFFPKDELDLVGGWLNDCEKLSRNLA